MIVIGLFSFLFGTIVGSFLNVVILRFNTGRSIALDRSQCFSCSATLIWKDLIPLISYLALSGRCRHCQSVFSIQYPLVEFLTGFLFVGLYLKYEHLLGASVVHFITSFLFTAVILSFFIVIFVYDLRHKIIPNVFVYSLISLSFIALFLYEWLVVGVETTVFTLPSLMHFLAGPLLFLPFFLLWFFSRGTWMGLGDGKLALPIGWLLGLSGGFSAMMLSFWLGALVGITLILTPRVLYFLGRSGSRVGQPRLFGGQKHFTMKSEVPFAPFLIIGFLLVFFFKINVLTFFT